MIVFFINKNQLSERFNLVHENTYKKKIYNFKKNKNKDNKLNSNKKNKFLF